MELAFSSLRFSSHQHNDYRYRKLTAPPSCNAANLVLKSSNNLSSLPGLSKNFSNTLLCRNYRHTSIRACSQVGTAGSDPVLDKISQFKDAFWRFLRPHTIRGTVLGSASLVTRALIENPNLIRWSLVLKAFSGLIALICGNGYIVGINQIYDIGIDKVNKPYLPIAAGDLSVQSAWILVLLFAVSGLLIVGLNFGPFITSLYCLGLFLGTIYSVPPFRLKRFAVIAFLIIATVRGFLLNYGVYYATRAALGLSFEWSSPVAFITTFVTVFALVIAITKDLPDVEGDRKFQVKNDLVVYTRLECESCEEMTCCIEKAKEEGADLVELCIDDFTFSDISQLEELLKQRSLPSIVSFRPKSPINSEGKKTCIQVLKLAVELDVEFVEVDTQVVCHQVVAELMKSRSNSKIIASTYVNGGNPTKDTLCNSIINLQSTGADIIKLVIDVAYITDVAPVFHMLTHSQVPLIVRAAGDRGLISQLLGPKYGAFFVCGSLGGKYTPGLPSLTTIKQVYKLQYVNPDTRIFGVISNPVGHSKGPLLHNPAFRHTGYNGIYVPLLVDNVKEFFRVFSCNDYAGFSVGIPHKEAAVRCCDEVDPLAKSIGAVNTIIRRPSDGKLIGYNTDCEACVTAIEDALRERQKTNGHASNVSPIAGKLFVLVGAGGAGRAIAFGAKSRGARVVIFNRKYERAKALAAAVSCDALPYEHLNDFCPEKGMILANASAVGMQPKSDQTPISKEALRSYELVFDAVYTPRNTRLLQEATEVGATVVSGVEMFVRQALGQFKLFTNGLAPVDFMRRIVYEQF